MTLIVAKVGHAGIKPLRPSHWPRSRDVTANQRTVFLYKASSVSWDET